MDTDIVFVLSTLEHVSDLSSAIKEISRVLKPQGSVILSSPTESRFYRFCRFFLFGVVEKDVHTAKSEPRSEADHHYHNVYGIEKNFFQNGFKQIKLKSLPSFPVPELHRVSKFKNITPNENIEIFYLLVVTMFNLGYKVNPNLLK